jgi:hypothetical protein
VLYLRILGGEKEMDSRIRGFQTTRETEAPMTRADRLLR